MSLRVTFTFNTQTLLRPRYLPLTQSNQPQYKIKPDPIYLPVRQFLSQYSQGYPFNILTLLHATAVKIFGYPCNSQRLVKRSLFATGGLYLALDLRHPDLALKRMFGDFTAGFSHQFGVGLSSMSMSEAFDISWDTFNPIEVRGKRVLDFEANLPRNAGKLQVEAKGVTSRDAHNKARRDIGAKKTKNSQQSQLGSTPPNITQVARVGVIVEAYSEKSAKPSRSKRGVWKLLIPSLTMKKFFSPRRKFRQGNTGIIQV